MDFKWISSKNLPPGVIDVIEILLTAKYNHDLGSYNQPKSNQIVSNNFKYSNFY